MRLSGSLSIQGCWLLRVVRGARPDRNPLRRGIDRLETCLLAGLFVGLAVATPVTARLAGHASYLSALHVRQEQLATRHQVRAVLADSADPADGYSLSTAVMTQATWTSVSGARRSGEVPAAPGSRKGMAVIIWTDGNGYLESPPLTVTEVADQGDATTAGVVVIGVVGFLAAAGTIRQLMNRRRMAAWEADWLVTARTWNHQSW